MSIIIKHKDDPAFMLTPYETAVATSYGSTWNQFGSTMYGDSQNDRFSSGMGKPFRLYAGSIIGLNVVDKLNNVKIAGYGLYDVMADMYTLKT